VSKGSAERLALFCVANDRVNARVAQSSLNAHAILSKRAFVLKSDPLGESLAGFVSALHSFQSGVGGGPRMS